VETDMTTTQRFFGAMVALMIAASTNARSVPSPATAVSIVLVHGVLIDGSSWRGVYDVLTRDGYRVSIVQEPLTGFDEDVAATRRVLEQQDGSVILVGHSYGGSIITVAGSDPAGQRMNSCLPSTIMTSQKRLTLHAGLSPSSCPRTRRS
jgi:pimeloyl-ACP methyl ester carboxylesterase